MECHQFSRNRTFSPRERSPAISGEERKASNDVGPASRLIKTAEQLPQRMPAEVVVLPSVAEDRLDPARRPGAHRTMVFADAFGERPRLPAFHPRGRYGNPVNAAAFDRHVSADIGETIA